MLDKKHQEYQEKIRAFCLDKIAPAAATLDEEQRVLEEHMAPMTEMGLMGCLIPEDYGGHKTDMLSYIIAVEELSRVCGSTGITIAAHNSLGCFPILEFGTEEQKRKYLPRAANGELVAFGLKEADSG